MKEFSRQGTGKTTKSKPPLPLVEFSQYERRVLEMPLRGEIRGHDAVALRKIIDTFPFMLRVAENRFDEGVAAACLHGAAMVVQAEEMIQNAERKAREPKPAQD